MKQLDPPSSHDLLSPKEETPRSHNYYGEIQDFQSLPDDNETEQEQRQTVLAGAAKFSDHDGEEIENACMLEERPHTEIGPSQLKRTPKDSVLLENLRKAMVQSCFNNDLELNTLLNEAPFMRVMKGTYGKSPEYAYDGSLNEKPMVYQLAKELIELNQYTTLGDFIEQVAAHVCEEEQRFQEDMNTMGEFTHQYEKLKRTKNTVRNSEHPSIYREGSRTKLQVCAAENFEPGHYEIFVQSQHEASQAQDQEVPLILAGFQMEESEEVVEDILQPSEGQLQTKVQENPEITFLVEQSASQDAEEEGERNREEFKE